jgi:hypothetical protein
VDKQISAPGVTGNFNFMEAISVQVATFVSVNSALKFSQNGVQLILDVGSCEPLFNIA